MGILIFFYDHIKIHNRDSKEWSWKDFTRLLPERVRECSTKIEDRLSTDWEYKHTKIVIKI